MGSSKQRWKIYFHRSASSDSKKVEAPKEFMCPISGRLMADPVIVSSGHTFERNCVEACNSISFTPPLPDGSLPNFSAIIPNLALKSTILNWCRTNLTCVPNPIDFDTAQKLVREYMIDIPSSQESVTLPLSTRPSCYSSSSHHLLSELGSSSQIFDQGEALLLLRTITRTNVESRARLCTPRILAALRSLILSKYKPTQVNSVAVLVNLSLEKQNKVKIVRSGIIPPLVDVLKGGFLESQEHAAGTLFSLALEDQNKTAIGVLGGLEPLLHSLRSDSDRTRHDSALALYHLTLVQSNRAKLVKFGGIQSLLGMLRSGHMICRVLLVLCNLATSIEGRAAMLDGGAMECFLGMLKNFEFDSESIRETCVTALYGLSQGGLRFKAMAKQAGAEEMLNKLEEMGSERWVGKVRKILEVLTHKDEDYEEVDWEELLSTEDDKTRTR